MDGFTSKFFKATQNIIKKDLIEAVLDFFDGNYMFVVVNCAIVTLIPKSVEAKEMKDMRPIACCSTVYKIIYKILTIRLSKIINFVVDDSQSTFLPGKSDTRQYHHGS